MTMHTFDLISKKIIDIEHDTFLFANIHKINFFIFLQKEYSIKNKFIFLNETIENIFNTDEIKEKFLDYFNKIQKTYNAFSRLAFLYKYRKAKIMIHTDLIMNDIKENEKYVFCLLQNNCKYLFKIHELIKIIDNYIFIREEDETRYYYTANRELEHFTYREIYGGKIIYDKYDKSHKKYNIWYKFYDNVYDVYTYDFEEQSDKSYPM